MDIRLTQAFGLASSIMTVLYIVFDTMVTLLGLEPVKDSLVQLAHTADVAPMLDLAGLAVYAIPSTSVLGALVLTGNLGGCRLQRRF